MTTAKHEFTVQHHGSKIRGLDNVSRSSVRDARFGRMFRGLGAAHTEGAEAALLDLAKAMFHGEFADRIARNMEVDVALTKRDADRENPRIPAGYTYLGQFIAHDITFDPASLLDRFNDPEALQDFRTPRLDLDSVYGSGPDDQPFLYDSDGAHFLLGDNIDFDEERPNPRRDLPRNAATPRRALIGDKRNDENIIISQLHALFLRFHNAVLDSVSGDFKEAQRLVRWHYQWIVLHDFLKRLLNEETYKNVIRGPGQTPIIQYYEVKGRYAFMPVEFSAAAYRFGHSMVRPSYALSWAGVSAQSRDLNSNIPPRQLMSRKIVKGKIVDDKIAKFHRIPIFSLTDPAEEPRANLNGFRDVPATWAIDWFFFFDGVKPDGIPPDKAVLPQPSQKIDTILVDPLAHLPDHQGEGPDRQSLPALNLLRGWRLGLPSGQAVARRMDLQFLTDKEIFNHDDPKRSEERAQVFEEHRDKFEGNAPLWFYILREAELLEQGTHLGPVGGTIVAEVLAGLMLEDGHSFLSQSPRWRPTLPRKTPGDFTMADLVNFATQRF